MSPRSIITSAINWASIQRSCSNRCALRNSWPFKTHSMKTLPPEEILRVLIRARLRSINGKDLPDWHSRLLAHELAQPTPALRQLVDKLTRPIYKRLLELIGAMIGLPPSDDNPRLCAISVVGQVLAYVLPGPLLTEIWPELRMTPERVERIADHIAVFSLSYLQDSRSKHGMMTPARKRMVSK